MRTLWRRVCWPLEERSRRYNHAARRFCRKWGPRRQSLIRSSTSAGGRGAPSHDKLGRDDNARPGSDPAVDLSEEQMQAAPPHLGEVLPDGGEGRREVGRLGDVVETDHADLARRLAAGLLESAEETEGHLIVRHEDGGHTRLGEEVLADVVSRARAPVAPEQRRLGSARGSERRTPPF